MDGEPLDGARIVFTSLEVTPPQSAAATIVQGEFFLTEKNGPLPGRNRIQILPEEVDEGEALARSQKAGGRPFTLDRVPIPEVYRTRSSMSVDISLTKPLKLRVELTKQGAAAGVIAKELQ